MFVKLHNVILDCLMKETPIPLCVELNQRTAHDPGTGPFLQLPNKTPTLTISQHVSLNHERTKVADQLTSITSGPRFE